MRANRRSLLAKIHIAKKQLGLDDPIYRTILAELFDAESAKNLKITELVRLVQHLEQLGFTPTRKNRPASERDRLVKRIWAQCYSLNRPVPDYADGLARHMFHLDKVIWCDPDQLRKLSAALTYQQKREGADTQ
jgi:phage gp16-like protein